jgi:hypothetical protein
MRYGNVPDAPENVARKARSVFPAAAFEIA